MSALTTFPPPLAGEGDREAVEGGARHRLPPSASLRERTSPASGGGQ
jgi:hypothetical protein